MKYMSFQNDFMHLEIQYQTFNFSILFWIYAVWFIFLHKSSCDNTIYLIYTVHCANLRIISNNCNECSEQPPMIIIFHYRYNFFFLISSEFHYRNGNTIFATLILVENVQNSRTFSSM